MARSGDGPEDRLELRARRVLNLEGDRQRHLVRRGGTLLAGPHGRGRVMEWHVGLEAHRRLVGLCAHRQG